MEQKDQITEKIIGCCFNVHKVLGPGFNEKIYQNALKMQFEEQGIGFEIEKEYKVNYASKEVGKFRVDMVVEDKVIVEIKALAGNIAQIFEYQVISYLKSSGLKVGLLINFGNKSCQIKRIMY
ncbi:MAG: GxxExxY protein [Elusimicrobia bacterium]|nr:GxxExxY protein [Elusimicrobiota bacterium]